MGKIKISNLRDGLVEEFHEGYFVKYSNVDCENSYPYYLRSCAKPLQATLLIDHGIDFSEEELALCAGSHSGEECHINIARRILEKIELDENSLKCGVTPPLSRSMQDKMMLNGEQPCQLHNNCSGKHLGFLALCKKNNWDLMTYDEPNHPLQIEVKNKINQMCGIETHSSITTDGFGGVCIHDDSFPMTTDGCGVPILSMPLYNMLKGYISLLDYPQIINAIKNNPYIFGGENRLDTEIIQNSDNLIAKVGAGGLCIVLNIVEKDAFVVKINDCSQEARRIAVLEAINRLGWGNIPYDSKIKTIAGKVVGEIIVNNF